MFFLQWTACADGVGGRHLWEASQLSVLGSACCGYYVPVGTFEHTERGMRMSCLLLASQHSGFASNVAKDVGRYKMGHELLGIRYTCRQCFPVMFCRTAAGMLGGESLDCVVHGSNALIVQFRMA